jgi:hypothetical protein
VNNSAWTAADDAVACLLPMSARNNRILHIDGDSFFANCEIALNPKLEGRKVWVGGGRRGDGIVIAANRQAKKYGIAPEPGLNHLVWETVCGTIPQRFRRPAGTNIICSRRCESAHYFAGGFFSGSGRTSAATQLISGWPVGTNAVPKSVCDGRLGD